MVLCSVDLAGLEDGFYFEQVREYTVFAFQFRNGVPRTVVLKKKGGTFGFVLCGVKGKYLRI